jgi:hypothetical protein
MLDQRFELRKQQWLADCRVPPATFRGAVRLEAFAAPFIVTVPGPETREYSRIYLSDLPRKDAEAIAHRIERVLQFMDSAEPRE